MTILITGKRGFLSSILLEELQKEHHITSLSRSNSADIVADLTAFLPKLPHVDLVIHNAGYAHSIPKNQSQVTNFYATNVDGTKNLLKALESSDVLPNTIVYISTVAVYGLDMGENIDESMEPRPNTPYADSKLQAENLIINWCDEHKVSAVILRLPLIIGKNPKGNLASLHKSIIQGWFIRILHNQAQKSTVLATDIAKLIPSLHNKNGIYNLTDGLHPNVNDIASAIAIQSNKHIYFKIPLSILQYAAKLGDLASRLNIPFPITTDRLTKMTNTLTFSDSKARRELKWDPNSTITWLRSNPL